MTDIKNKAILLTGASSGIGWAAARLLAEKGALLSIVARRVARLETLAKEIQGKTGIPPLVLPADVSRKKDVESIIQKTYDHYGRIDVLINNAAVLYMEPLIDMPLDRMENLWRTNFWSMIYAIQTVTPIMEKQGGGHILNVGSAVSRRALPYMSLYAASKFAMTGLTESVRLELRAKKIDFTLIYPGGVDTEMPNNVNRSRLPAGYPDHSRSRIPAERAAKSILCAIKCKPLEVYVPWWTRLAAWLSVFSPTLADGLIRKAQRID